MPDLDLSLLNLNGSDDDHALKYLAGSLIRHGNELPDELQKSIYNAAVTGKFIGLPHTVQLQQQVDSLLRRNVDGFDADRT